MPVAPIAVVGVALYKILRQTPREDGTVRQCATFCILLDTDRARPTPPSLCKFISNYIIYAKK